MTASRAVFIKTYGCQMNAYDSERMGDVLAGAGYRRTEDPAAADLIVLNTCHIRERAAEKVYSELGKLKRLKQRNGNLLIAVAGCVAQAEGEEIVRRAPAVDLVFGPQTYHRLPSYLETLERTGRAVVETEFPAAEKFAMLDQDGAGRKPATVAAFVTVQEGCDKFCTFCVVPYTRGAEFSRPVARILDEVRRLAARGVREITLLGQNVNAYRGEGPRGGQWSLAELLAELAGIAAIERLRYTTSHPRDMDEPLIAAHRDNPKLMPYLHLPVQAGSDRVLKAMNRRHRAATYVALIERIRAARPDIAISGDFIVGFPGESEEDFELTLELVRKVRYASAFSFAYSPRPGTPAAELPGQVPAPRKNARLLRLQALLAEQRLAFNVACVGRQFDVLLEKPGRHPGQLVGRSPYLQAVHLEAKGYFRGDLVPVVVEKVGANSLSAHIVARE
ncbi:MAG: tRNA (N6-isopentenyl adenosine(37)-C2)-methylthiotransferase MiaB [Aestuariivirgaceae bacterium]